MPPTTARQRKGKKLDDAGPGVQIDWQGRRYVVRQFDLTPRLVAELRRETGFAGWIGLVNELQRGGFDLDIVAALLWLSRRVDGETVAYLEVLDGMSYEGDLAIEPARPDQAAGVAIVDGEAAPEA